MSKLQTPGFYIAPATMTLNCCTPLPYVPPNSSPAPAVPASGKVCRRDAPRTRRGLHGRRLHAHLDFADPAQQCLQRQADLQAHFAIQQVDAEGVECLNVFFKVFAGEVGVAFHDVHDDWAPGFDVPWLSLVEEVEASDDVRT